MYPSRTSLSHFTSFFAAVILTNALIRDYLLNYARSLIYTTSLSYANIIAADSSFDMLTNGIAQHVSQVTRNVHSHSG